MKYKIYTEGNQFVLENSVGYKHISPLENVDIIPANNKNGSPRFRIKGLNRWNEKKWITLDETAKADGSEMSQSDFDTIMENNVSVPVNYVVKESVFASMTVEQKKGKTFDVIAD